MRLRVLTSLLMPITAALVIGVLIGTLVVAPMVNTGSGPVGRGPGASPRAVAAVPSSSGNTAGITPAPGGSSARPASAKPGASGKPAGDGKPTASGNPDGSAAPSLGASAAAALNTPAKEGVVPILYYHRVEGLPRGFAGWSKRSQDTFLVDDLMPYALVAQLDWLKANGYTTILPRDLAAHWDAGKALPKRPIILTFDDGFANWRSVVLPELQKRKMVAEFYVVIANVGRSISWTDVRTLAKAGMGIGAHDVQHVQLAGGGLPVASPAVMRYQVTEGKRMLEQNLGVTVDSMAYVGGGFNETLMGIVKEAGYSTARSIERGVVQAPGIRYRLHVSRISWHDDVTDLYNGRMAAGLPKFAQRVSGSDPG